MTTTTTLPGFRPFPGDTRAPRCPAGTELANAEAIASASLRAQMQASRDGARAAAKAIREIAVSEESALFTLSLQAIGTPDGPAVKALWEASLERRKNALERWLELF